MTFALDARLMLESCPSSAASQPVIVVDSLREGAGVPTGGGFADFLSCSLSSNAASLFDSSAASSCCSIRMASAVWSRSIRQPTASSVAGAASNWSADGATVSGQVLGVDLPGACDVGEGCVAAPNASPAIELAACSTMAITTKYRNATACGGYCLAGFSASPPELPAPGA